MSTNFETRDELDELSRLLDEMNAGQQPACGSQELTELLTVAALIKNTADPVCPPAYILEQTVNRALTGLPSEKAVKRRPWLFSGALGAAAAVLLVVGLNLLPFAPQKAPSLTTPPLITRQQEAAPVASEEASPSTRTAPTEPVNPPAMAEMGETVTVTVKSPLIAAPPKSAPAIPESPVVVATLPPSDEKRSFSSAPENNRPAQSQLFSAAAKPFVAKSAVPAPTLLPLTLPQQTPDRVITTADMIEQIYFQGTAREITITQRWPVPDSIAASSPSPALREKSAAKQPLINQIKLFKFGQEIIVAGHQPQEQLEQIAQSLIP